MTCGLDARATLRLWDSDWVSGAYDPILSGSNDVGRCNLKTARIVLTQQQKTREFHKTERFRQLTVRIESCPKRFERPTERFARQTEGFAAERNDLNTK